MALESWKDFPTPNPWFPPPVEPTTLDGWMETAATGAVRASFALFGMGMIFTAVVPIFAGFTPWANYGLFGMMAGWAAIFGSLLFYQHVMHRKAERERDFIPAVTEDVGHSCLFLLFISIPVCIVGMAAGFVGTLMMWAARSGKEEISVDYVENGRMKRRTLLVRKGSPKEMREGEIVWVTRPRLFVPTRAVDRNGVVGTLDHASFDAKDWLNHALERADERNDRIRQTKKRARNMKRIRHERGRAAAYAKRP